MKVLVADDHPLVRDALARAVRQLDERAEVVEADSFDALQALAETGAADLALVDLNMPGMRGLDGLRRLRATLPTLPIVVTSGQDDPATIRAVLATGVSGFIPKANPAALLLQALRLVQAGGVYIPSATLADLQQGVPPALPEAAFTPRQLDVLHCLMRGRANKLIARELGLTEGTVKIHIAAILRVLQVRNRTEAVVRARELGVRELGG